MTNKQNNSDDMNYDWQPLINAAWNAREHAYAPYSGFKVGAAVQTASGAIYGGCNIENVSYGLTNCAERTAMFQAVANGDRDLVRMVVCADTPEPIAPCGACRQVMVELGAQMELLLLSNTGMQIFTTVDDLMPYSFHQFRPDAESEKGDV